MEGTMKKQINKIKSKSKKKLPMKVVYISSPMKFKICASKFRDLVQELTGQDAELPDPNKIVLDLDGGVNDVRETITATTTTESSRTVSIDDDKLDCGDVVTKEAEFGDLLIGDFDLLLGDFDDVFVPQMFKNFSSELIPVELGA